MSYDPRNSVIDDPPKGSFRLLRLGEIQLPTDYVRDIFAHAAGVRYGWYTIRATETQDVI